MSVIRKRLVLLGVALMIGAGCQQEQEDDSMIGLLAISFLLNGNGNTSQIYQGMTDIPETVRSATSTMSTMEEELVVAGNPELEKMTHVFQPVRDAIELGRDIAFNVGTLIINLKGFNPGTEVNETTVVWGDQPAKIRYQADTTFGAGGRKLEVWWTAEATAPFTSKKAFELVFLDQNSGNVITSEVKGQVWGRFKDEDQSTLGLVHSTFENNPTTGISFMSIIIESAPDPDVESAHMYIRRENNVTSLDGTITFPGFKNPLTATADGSNGRAYVFSASGSDSTGKAAVQVAFPDGDSIDSNPYSAANTNSVPEVYTDWLLGISSHVLLLNLAGCSVSATSTAAELLVCMDTIRAGDSTAFADIYYVPNIQLPAYYSKDVNQSASLQSVGTAPDDSYAVYEAHLLNGIRSTGSDNYQADFLPNAVRTLSILNGVNVPADAVWTDGNSSGPF